MDQPEENLDPKSVFDELVSLFIAAKEKRQVIMVTHNANLVINTDADQVIVADAGPHTDGGLPRITYRAGGLEDAEMRKAVCEILEGGKRHFGNVPDAFAWDLSVRIAGSRLGALGRQPTSVHDASGARRRFHNEWRLPSIAGSLSAPHWRASLSTC